MTAGVGVMRESTIALLWIATLIAILELFALYRGIDGQLFFTTLSTLAGMFGYYLGRKRARLEAGV